ncbi:MAG: hypothetical protein HYT98_01005 [Candidatus Sungbacteria bacterium]|nr:hypothetical protein [Candidatus Sungbacteria bacterium]
MNIKEVILGLATLITSVASFWLWFRTIPQIISGEFVNVDIAIFPLVLLGLSAALFSLAVIFIRGSYIAYALALLSIVIPYFFLSAASAVIISMGVAMLLVFSASYRIRTEYMLSLGFHLTKILKSGLPVYLTAASLVISTLFFASLNEDKALSVLLPRSAFQTALPAILNYIIRPTGDALEFSPNATVQEVLSVVIKDQLQKQGIPLARISQKELNSAISLQIAELEKSYGLKLTGKESTSDVFYGLVNNQILTLVGPYRKYLPHVSALTFFFAFKVITIPLYYIVIAVLMVLIKILVAFKILKSEIVEMRVERLTL